MGGEGAMTGMEDMDFEQIGFLNDELNITRLVVLPKTMFPSCLMCIVYGAKARIWAHPSCEISGLNYL